jgi:hypothetical protein
MPGTWINRVQHVNDGEAVNGAVDSRPTRSLEGNTQYLKDRLDSAELGEGVLAYGETVEAAALVGMPVYRNSVTARYERAFAAVVQDPVSGVLVAAPSADVIGIVAFKWNATKADILLAGQQEVDISAAVDPATLVGGVAPPGRYYLSSATPGMLTQQRPPVSVSVLVYTDDGFAVVQPVQRDFLEDHIHYRFRLYAQPAGTNVLGVNSGEPGAGNRHSVGSPDPTKLGWLPATPAYFSVPIPTGAAFGYNLATHPQLARVFPPIPAGAAAIFVDRGEDESGGKLVPLGPGGLCVVDRNGLWWMSDCEGDAPWPTDWLASVPPPASGPDPPWLTGNDPTGPESPRQLEFQITLAYTAMVFTTERTSVTSLRPAAGSPLTFSNCDGAAATTGDLEADLDLTFLVDDIDLVPGFTVFKELDGTTFKRGYAVEGLVAGPSCVLASQTVATLPDGVTPLYQGIITVNVATAAGERELPVDLVRLDQTLERYYLEVPYIGFDAGYDTSVRMRFFVPTAGLPNGPAVAVRMQLLGRAAGTLPALALSYRILPRPYNPTTGLPAAINLPGLNAELPLNIVTAVPIGAEQYIDVQSDPIPDTIYPGATILVTLTRSAGDGYAAEVGLMRPVGVLTGTTAGAAGAARNGVPAASSRRR